MDLETLRPAKGAVKNNKRRGRGVGSGQGRAGGRGNKGQKSRSGYSSRPGFEGGQMPLQRRVPKRGFHNLFRKEYAFVNVSTLADRFEAGASVSPPDLRAKGVIKHLRDGLKVLGNGDIAIALTVRAHAFTAGAREKIEKAGGSCEVIEG
jgi:large subunit ribosomal protein L15